MAVLGNVWKRFIDLLPKTPRMIGEVGPRNSDGKYLITLYGAGTTLIWSDTDYPLGSKVFVKGGVIEGPAPALTPVIIEV